MGEACDGHSALTPYPTPLLFFPAPISLCCPHNLKTRKYSWEMVTSSVVPINYRKIPKISPGAPGLLSKALCEGLMFGGAYVRREICVSKSIWQAFSLEGNLPVFLFYFVFEGNFQVQAPPPLGGGLYLEGRFNGGFFALRFWGACTWRGLFSEFYGTSQLITNFSKNEKEWMLP